MSAETGETVHPYLSTTVMDAPDLLTFRAEGRDADCNSCEFISVPGPEDGIDWVYTGCWDCDWEISAAYTDVIVPLGGDPSESFTGTANVVAEGFTLELIAHVNYSVSYVP